MCGIVGAVSCDASQPVDVPLDDMIAALTHRGPDRAGAYRDPRGVCQLGFRRLAIIDLATGDQPLSDPSGRVHVVFNGEIYNFRELRRELEQQGVCFRTQGDAEVIAALYAAEGERAFERLLGMFAIGLWDSAERKLLLVRDRLGQKPLVYMRLRDRLVFASEIKALLADPATPRTIDRQSLHEYLVFQYVPAPRSIFTGIEKVPPGCVVEVKEGRIAPPRKYWQLDPTRRFNGSYADARDALVQKLTTATERRLIADVPLGAFLSGGVDSSLVVALMRKLGVEPLRTFSIGFDDPRYDERRYAKLVAQRFGTEHHEEMVTPRARDILDTLAYHYDEPFADSSAIPTYYLAQVTRKHVTVALTGDAGDESFLGYDRYRAAELAAVADRLPKFMRAALGGAAQFLPRGRAKSRSRRAWRLLSAMHAPAADRYMSWVNIFALDELCRGYTPEALEGVTPAGPREWLAELYKQHPGAPAEKASWTDLHSYLPYDLLTKVDIASMACSLECRSPFLDHELVEFAVSLPPEWRRGKRILKDLAQTWLPPEVLNRPKMGFGVPIGEWFRGELRTTLNDALFDSQSLCRQLFRPDWLRSLVDAHLSGRDELGHPLWTLLMLEIWQRRWNACLA